MAKQAKGFGKPQAAVEDARKFLLAFTDCMAEAQGDKAQLHQFLHSHLDSLDESLLATLPQIFAALTDGQPPAQQKNIAYLFGNFCLALQDFSLGRRWLNIEFCIVVYHLILNVFTQELSPENWAAIQNNLGNAYRDRVRGDRADNLEQAITAFENALQVRTRETFPVDWAMAQNNLGTAYWNRIRGDHADNLEQAISAYENALQVYTREAFPVDWAMTQNNLGTAYWNRIRGDHADNLEQAIAAYENALQIRTREAFPEQWATTQNNLGNAYSNRIRGDHADNLEQAISAYENALQVYTREAFPVDWAMTQNNLGTAYKKRIRGDHADNLEQAISAYENALQVRTREALPQDWADTQNNLGSAYSNRIQGDRADNLEQAIAAYENALQVATREALPQDWAMTLGNLAGALKQQAELTGNGADLDTAITLLQAALEVAIPGSSTFINTQYRLGNALSRRYDSSQNPTDLEQAAEAYKIALEAISPEHYDRKQMWQALPTVQSILGSRLVRDGRWQEGLQLLLNSVRQLSNSDDPLVYADALFQTGRAHETMADWDNARLYYRDALRLYDHLENQPGIAQSRAGLGGVLVSQGFLEKGMAELAQARELYQQLEQPDEAAKLEHLYQTAQRALERQQEVYL